MESPSNQKRKQKCISSRSTTTKTKEMEKRGERTVDPFCLMYLRARIDGRRRRRRRRREKNEAAAASFFGVTYVCVCMLSTNGKDEPIFLSYAQERSSSSLFPMCVCLGIIESG